MRLKPAKIDSLSQQIFQALADNQEVTIEESQVKIVGLIRQVITEDLKAEDEIEEAARKMLEEHMDAIRAKGASYDKLLLKAKRKIAEERKMVL